MNCKIINLLFLMNFGSFGRLVDSVTEMFCDGQSLNMEQIGQQLDGNFSNNYDDDEDQQFMAREVESQPQFFQQPQFVQQPPRPQKQRQQAKPKKNYEREIYKFRVGVRPLGIGFGVGEGIMYGSGPTHACFLIDRDIFEYGLHETNKRYIRRRNVGRLSSFDWDRLGKKMHRTTYVSPDQLEEAILRSNEWNGNEYVLTDLDGPSHNCHDFVRFCIQACTSKNCGMAQKKHAVYIPQDEHNFQREINNTVGNFLDELAMADDLL